MSPGGGNVMTHFQDHYLYSFIYFIFFFYLQIFYCRAPIGQKNGMRFTEPYWAPKGKLCDTYPKKCNEPWGGQCYDTFPGSLSLFIYFIFYKFTYFFFSCRALIGQRNGMRFTGPYWAPRGKWCDIFPGNVTMGFTVDRLIPLNAYGGQVWTKLSWRGFYYCNL